VNVPTNTTLSLINGTVNEVVLSTVPFQYMSAPYICSYNPYSHPGLPTCALPINPGLLLPNTTYYWQGARVCDQLTGCFEGVVAFTPVFSFTTGGPVASAQASWGAVKAMYRK
jgi:hypothetical protein